MGSSTSYIEGLQRLPIATALRRRLRSGYSLKDLKSDLLAGLVVCSVAIPLGMALAVAVGVDPEHGLYTVVIAGMAIALLGGSRFQVSGPTAAFVVILVPIVQRFGLSGLLMAGFMAGVFLVAIGLTGLGRFIQFIPYPVTTGFTAGIGVVIATIQLKDFFGLEFSEVPENYFLRLSLLWQYAGSFRWQELGVGLLTLGILIVWPKINKRLPAPLVALALTTALVWMARHFFSDLEVSTLGTRFSGGIPQQLPSFQWPWLHPDPSGRLQEYTFAEIQSLIPSAVAIAFLGAIESLLSAVVADGLTQTEHDPDAELVASGIGNMLCPFFGGIAATGAIARTATNIRYGATSPLASFFHALFALAVILVLAPVFSHLPMASLAALLILVAFHMSDARHFFHVIKVAPRGDVLVLLLCFSFTVLFDMVIGVFVGFLFAVLLLMRRVSTLTSTEILNPHGFKDGKSESPLEVRSEKVIYRVAGPLFFGAAQGAMRAVGETSGSVKEVVFLMDQVPVMDMTGLVAFENTVANLSRRSVKVSIVGLKGQPKNLIERSQIITRVRNLRFLDSL